MFVVPFAGFQLLDIYWKNEHRLMCTGEICTAAERDRYEKANLYICGELRSSSSLESKGSSMEMLCGNVIWPKEGGGFVNGNGGKTADPSDLNLESREHNPSATPASDKLKDGENITLGSSDWTFLQIPQKNSRNELLRRVVAD
ncbi:hypothetical protein ACET3Z_011627 [Daucus carota]